VVCVLCTIQVVTCVVNVTKQVHKMGLESAQERHRPGALKQQNKVHKHGRHRSKGAIDSATKGTGMS
jgi:hypothetical protein